MIAIRSWSISKKALPLKPTDRRTVEHRRSTDRRARETQKYSTTLTAVDTRGEVDGNADDGDEDVGNGQVNDEDVGRTVESFVLVHHGHNTQVSHQVEEEDRPVCQEQDDHHVQRLLHESVEHRVVRSGKERRVAVNGHITVTGIVGEVEAAEVRCGACFIGAVAHRVARMRCEGDCRAVVEARSDQVRQHGRGAAGECVVPRERVSTKFRRERC